jgi:hypothetical protein
MGIQNCVTWPDLINPRVPPAIAQLYDHVFSESRDGATIRCRRVPPEGLETDPAPAPTRGG